MNFELESDMKAAKMNEARYAFEDHRVRSVVYSVVSSLAPDDFFGFSVAWYIQQKRIDELEAEVKMLTADVNADVFGGQDEI